MVEILPGIPRNSYQPSGFKSVSGNRIRYSEAGSSSSFAGIDVSKYQGDIDWKKVAADGIDFAMIRMGARGYSSGNVLLDDKFFDNMKGCSENGIKVGIYFYSQAMTEAEAVEEEDDSAIVIGGAEEEPAEEDSETDSDEILADEDLGSICVSNEIFFKLIKRLPFYFDR